MVYQVWEDGEITLQKAGDLLWCRNLHCIVPGTSKSVLPSLMPCQIRKHGYVNVASIEDAQLARECVLILASREFSEA